MRFPKLVKDKALAPNEAFDSQRVDVLGIFLPGQTNLMDAYTRYAASAIAANTLLRSILGSMVPLFGYKMYESLGLGWGNSLLGFIAIAFLPLPVLFYKFGERIRMRATVEL
ncbi:hypothetical protein SI65_08628 [Aspergillus cristatus]|uniref:Major facilitator superfamily (MFS) profile domain-containing protein n=1 Tax=Aspergillus cristatus TaxID=573508 RepID=A0A1E3B4H9_ASPCR|nr:hypothetical protein SI65_08628 [Aspergillus cristatus]